MVSIALFEDIETTRKRRYRRVSCSHYRSAWQFSERGNGSQRIYEREQYLNAILFKRLDGIKACADFV